MTLAWLGRQEGGVGHLVREDEGGGGGGGIEHQLISSILSLVSAVPALSNWFSFEREMHSTDLHRVISDCIQLGIECVPPVPGRARLKQLLQLVLKL